MNNKYYNKYRKYKAKYIKVKKILEGGKEIQMKGIHMGMKTIKEKDFPYRNILSDTLLDLKKIKNKTNSDDAIAPAGQWYGFKHYWKERTDCNFCLWNTVVEENEPDKVYEFEE